MKTRTVVIIFVSIALILGVAFFFSNKFLVNKNSGFTRAKIVTPKTLSVSEDDTEKSETVVSSEKYETFVPLYTGETLISTLTFDFNNDGYDDEVIVIRKNTSQLLYIVPGLYDSVTGDYNRLEEIPTSFSRTRTFSYSGMDLIGDHKNTLIIQGIDDDSNYVMKLYMFNDDFGENDFSLIGDFISDGTIFIQQVERSESYELNLSKGESYSVWVYKSDETEKTDDKNGNSVGANQIQQEYKWNAQSQKYELSQEIKVTAGKLAAKELSRIQDGTVETFASFLNGLWYKTSNDDGTVRYIYFNYDSKEIIQFITDTQEVYEWEDSKLRHNGIYLTTVNADIMNLHRRFDISLTNVDEIRITLRDDINLVIKENTMWDGQYKKLSIQSTFSNPQEKTDLDILKTELKKADHWLSTDSFLNLKFTDYSYESIYEEAADKGIYSLEKIGDYSVIQFRSNTESAVLNPAYSITFGQKVVTETVKKKTTEKIVTDYDTIYLTPVKVTPTDCFVTEGKAYSLQRKVAGEL